MLFKYKLAVGSVAGAGKVRPKEIECDLEFEADAERICGRLLLKIHAAFANLLATKRHANRVIRTRLQTVFAERNLRGLEDNPNFYVRQELIVTLGNRFHAGNIALSGICTVARISLRAPP